MTNRLSKAYEFFRPKSNKQAYLYTFLSSILIFFIVFIAYGVAPFGDKTLCTNDGIAQYIPFMNSLYDKLKDGESLLYSHSGALGFNYFATMAYYLISPFSLLCLLFSKENIPIAVNLIIALKICCVTTGMTYYLLHRFKRKNGMAVLFSLAYGFSYFFVGYMYNLMWMDCVIAFPFILRGLETIRTKRGKTQYIISLAYCLVCNFYLGAIVCIFLVLYYVFICEHKKFKDFIISGCHFGWASIVAAMIAGIVLVPMAMNVFSTGTSRTELPEFGFFNQLTYIFERHLPTIDIKTLSKNDGDANLFATILVFMLASMFGFNKTVSKRRKIGTILLVMFLIFCFSNTWGNYFMHGFYKQRQVPNRFGFMYIFLLVAMAYETITNFKGVDKKFIPFICLMLAVVCASAYIDMDYSGLSTYNDWFEKLTPAIYCAIGMVVYAILLIGKEKNKIYIPIVLTLEICCMIFPNAKTATISSSFTMLPNYVEALESTRKGETGLYREEVLSTDSTNAPTMYGMRGVTSFNSILNTKTANILGQLGFTTSENYYRYFGHSAVTDSIFGVKYIFSKYDELLPDTYEKLEKVGDVNIYKNKYVLPIGIALDMSFLSENYANKFDNINALTASYEQMFNNLPIKTSYETENITVSQEDNSNFKISSTKKDDSIIFTLGPIEHDDVYLYTKTYGDCDSLIKVNDRILSSLSYTGYMVYLGDLTEDDVVTIKYTAKSAFTDKKTTFFVSSLDKTALENFYNEVSEKSLYDVEYTANTVSGKVNATETTGIVFTMPYDKGWSATVDDGPVEIQPVNDGLMSITVEEGEHIIKLKYTPVGFRIGELITIIGLLLLLCYVVFVGNDNTSTKFSVKDRLILIGHKPFVDVDDKEPPHKE